MHVNDFGYKLQSFSYSRAAKSNWTELSRAEQNIGRQNSWRSWPGSQSAAVAMFLFWYKFEFCASWKRHEALYGTEWQRTIIRQTVGKCHLFRSCKLEMKLQEEPSSCGGVGGGVVVALSVNLHGKRAWLINWAINQRSQVVTTTSIKLNFRFFMPLP